MSHKSWLLGGALAAALVACGWLYVENRSLRRQLADAGDHTAPQASKPAVADSDATREPSPGSRPESRRSLFSGWSFAGRRDRPALPEESDAPRETRAERRKQRQTEIAAMFGRLDGETAEDYRARMAPFVKLTLAGPRDRLAEARREVEQAANVSDEQRAALDAVFQDAYQEAIDLANRAMSSGDLTPYSRNWSGLLNVAGGMGAVLEGAETRIRQVLTPEQAHIIYEQGFEWGEYLAVTVPWEDLDAPPPPPGS